MYTALAASSALLKPARANTAFSLALQLTHQLAVMFTNTTRSCARRPASACSENATLAMPLLVAASVVSGFGRRCSANSGQHTPAAATSASASQPRPPPLRARVHAHAASASAIAATSHRPAASAPRCLASTHTSQAAVAYIGNASNCFRVSIHAPGFGSSRANAGTKPISRNGNARPRPSIRNTSIPPAVGPVNA